MSYYKATTQVAFSVCQFWGLLSQVAFFRIPHVGYMGFTTVSTGSNHKGDIDLFHYPGEACTQGSTFVRGSLLNGSSAFRDHL